MAIIIPNQHCWDLSPVFVLESTFRFGDRPLVTKFVYSPTEQVLVLGAGHATPSHKTLISSRMAKRQLDISWWVRGIVLREKGIVYYRQGVRDLDWYARTTRLLQEMGMPGGYRVLWGPEAKRMLAEDLSGYP